MKKHDLANPARKLQDLANPARKPNCKHFLWAPGVPLNKTYVHTYKTLYLRFLLCFYEKAPFMKKHDLANPARKPNSKHFL